MIKFIIFILIHPISLIAMEQKTDWFYRKKIQKTKANTPSYCSCTSYHYMIYNSPEIIYLLYALHLPQTKESKESIALGKLIEKHIAKQETINRRYKKKVENLIKALCAQVHSNN